MKKGAVNLEMAKSGAVLCQKRGAVVSQLVPKLKESVPPPPPATGPTFCVRCSGVSGGDSG